jgi:hypothetical protein
MRPRRAGLHYRRCSSHRRPPHLLGKEPPQLQALREALVRGKPHGNCRSGDNFGPDAREEGAAVKLVAQVTSHEPAPRAVSWLRHAGGQRAPTKKLPRSPARAACSPPRALMGLRRTAGFPVDASRDTASEVLASGVPQAPLTEVEDWPIDSCGVPPSRLEAPTKPMWASRLTGTRSFQLQRSSKDILARMGPEMSLSPAAGAVSAKAARHVPTLARLFPLRGVEECSELVPKLNPTPKSDSSCVIVVARSNGDSRSGARHRLTVAGGLGCKPAHRHGVSVLDALGLIPQVACGLHPPPKAAELLSWRA